MALATHNQQHTLHEIIFCLMSPIGASRPMDGVQVHVDCRQHSPSLPCACGPSARVGRDKVAVLVGCGYYYNVMMMMVMVIIFLLLTVCVFFSFFFLCLSCVFLLLLAVPKTWSWCSSSTSQIAAMSSDGDKER